jgi:hypothetical protein
MDGHGHGAWTPREASDAEIAALRGVGRGERYPPMRGVRALMLALLEDALRAYRGPVPRARREAALWIEDERSRWLFSFPVVCETLGLEPSAVRAAVYRMPGASSTQRFGRSRPNARRQPGRDRPLSLNEEQDRSDAARPRQRVHLPAMA